MYIFSIELKKCNNCNICKKNCPVDAIIKDNSDRYIIVYNKCFLCGICFFCCPIISIYNKNIYFFFNLNNNKINKKIFIKKFYKKK